MKQGLAARGEVANWQKDLARGDVGEQDFLRTFPMWRKADDSMMYECDFINDATGETAELKTDYYHMDKTPNLIVERYSNEQRGTPGGPFRHSGNLGYWVYYYKKDGVFLFYDASQLVERVQELNLKLISIPNPGYTTGVYRVRRQDVSDCLLQVVVLSATTL